ncbi:hypothetical protein L6R52_04830 [Myxococcota bacterium]|nr:hypothetical protein [Myxococcota bacterium]
MKRARASTFFVVFVAASSSARADEPTDAEPVGREPIEEVAIQDGSSSAAPETPDAERVAELEARVEQLEEQLANEPPVSPPESPITVGAYLDFGAFVPIGMGAGFVEDFGNASFPEYSGKFGWVFLGDILGSPVNSRGEAADLGEAPGTPRADSVDSKGRPGFIANELNLSMKAGLGSSARFRASINFVPRSGRDFALGDFFDLDLAEMEWIVSEEVPTSIFVGKIEPVFGIEYKDRKSPARIGVTPSLVARYTTGTQLGLKARSKLLSEWLVLSASVTNGSSTQEQFHFYDEIDSNWGKTLTGRAALSLHLSDWAPAIFSSPLELGFSAQWGAQDLARDSRDVMKFFGPDLEYRGVNLNVKAQLMWGDAPGRAEDEAFSLDLVLGGYLETSWLFDGTFGLLARVDFRDARVALGTERLYLTKTWRLTVGGRAIVSPNLIVKVEALKSFEFGGIPEIDNDMLTSSLLVVF